MKKPMKRANGDGSIIKLSGNRRKPFAVRVTVGYTEEGKQLYKYVGYYEKITMAKEALRDYLADPYDIMNKDITLAQLYNLVIEDKKSKVAQNTMKAYRQSFKKLEPLHSEQFTSLRKAHFQSIVNQYSHSIGSKIKILLGNLYGYAMDNDIIRRNYAENIELSKKPDDPTIDRTIFSQDEIDRLWENRGEKDVDIVLMMLYSGVRIGEIFSIKNENIDLEARTMIGGSKTTSGKNRVIPIHKRIIPLIENRMKSENEFLIVNRYGKQMNHDKFRERRWHPIMTENGMKHTPHDTRHTFVTSLHNKDVRPDIVDTIIGHATDNLALKVYNHKTVKQLLNAVDLLD